MIGERRIRPCPDSQTVANGKDEVFKKGQHLAAARLWIKFIHAALLNSLADMGATDKGAHSRRRSTTSGLARIGHTSLQHRHRAAEHGPRELLCPHGFRE
jgi:hypothetical protein